MADTKDTTEKYSKLNKFAEYDHDAAEQLAEALNDLKEIESQATQLREMIDDNKELHPFVWTTAEGKALALHQIEDEHFANILTHIVERGDTISKALKGEARRRKVVIPSTAAENRRYLLSRSQVIDIDAGF